MGIEVRFFDPDHPEQIDALVDENTRCVYMESIGNPKNDVPDFRAIFSGDDNVFELTAAHRLT